MPASFVKKDEDAETLIITLEDKKSSLEFELFYTIFKDQPVITRSVKVKNMGSETHFLNKISSMQLDFVDQEFEIITLPGAHMNERQLSRSKIDQGIHTYASNRGTSSPQMNPFITLANHDTNEFNGKAYGFAFVYSGNHKFEVEKDQIEQLRLNVGINNYGFAWKLNKGAEFQTPEVVLTYSDRGLNQMSQTFHHFVKEHIIRSRYKDMERPILVNNWEATYFDFTEEKLLPLVDKARKLGIEMFVLDDGWFGHRDSDRSSLGDRFTYDKKFPNGLEHLAKYVHGQGMKFGLWFEPEKISLDSELYRHHHDYLMYVPGREPTPSRRQFVLDLGIKEVCDNIYQQIKRVLDTVKIDYIKWDMNRHLTDIYEADLPADQQGEVYHRYVLGLYDLMEKLVSDYPDILFEACSLVVADVLTLEWLITCLRFGRAMILCC